MYNHLAAFSSGLKQQVTRKKKKFNKKIKKPLYLKKSYRYSILSFAGLMQDRNMLYSTGMLKHVKYLPVKLNKP